MRLTSRLVVLIIALVCASGCATSNSTIVDVEPLDLSGIRVIRAVAFHAGEAAFFLVVEREGRCLLERLDPGARQVTRVRDLPRCGSSLEAIPNGDLILRDGLWSYWMARDGATVEGMPGSVAAARNRGDMIRDTGDGLIWQRDGEQIPLTGFVAAPNPVILRDEGAIIGVRSVGTSSSLVRFEPRGAIVEIAGPFAEIDSFDLAPDELELVLSARQDESLDVAIASTAGGSVNWVYPSAQDERLVSWAPRGNKITYVLDGNDGSLVRTVHVPTSVALAIDQAGGFVESIEWEPNAERFAMVWSGPDRSSRLDLIRYSGEDRENVLESSWARQWDIDRDPRLGEGTVVVPPSRVRYGKRYPVVVWLGVEQPLRFDAARAALYENGGSGMIASPRDVAGVDGPFRRAILDLAWTDPANIIFVSMDPGIGGRAPEMDVRLVEAVKGAGSSPRAVVGQGGRSRRIEIEIPDGMNREAVVSGFLDGYLKQINHGKD